MRTIPLILANATLTLYAADANGNAILSEALWMGARVEGLRLLANLEEIESTPTGADYPEYESGDQEHQIYIDRIWVLPASTKTDYSLEGRDYVLVVYGLDKTTNIWHRRTYYGVRARTYELQSNGILYFGTKQEFRAQYFVGESGVGDETTEVSALTEHPVLFTKNDPLMVGDYLVGLYQFTTAITINWIKAIALASQGEPTVLSLEIGGGLTPHELVLPAGGIIEEVSAELIATILVPANQSLRWKVTAGPGSPEQAAWVAGVSMNILL